MRSHECTHSTQATQYNIIQQLFYEIRTIYDYYYYYITVGTRHIITRHIINNLIVSTCSVPITNGDGLNGI